MLRFCRNIAEAMRSSVKHTPTLPSRVEECRLSLKQILNGKRRVSICVKSVIRMYLIGQERQLKKLLFQIVYISFEEF